MKKKLFFVLMPLLAFINATFAQNQDSKLTKVTITFSTHNDNKDHDTRLNVNRH